MISQAVSFEYKSRLHYKLGNPDEEVFTPTLPFGDCSLELSDKQEEVPEDEEEDWESALAQRLELLKEAMEKRHSNVFVVSGSTVRICSAKFASTSSVF